MEGVTVKGLSKDVKINDVYKRDISNVKKLLIRDGTTGEAKTT